MWQKLDNRSINYVKTVRCNENVRPIILSIVPGLCNIGWAQRAIRNKKNTSTSTVLLQACHDWGMF